MNWSARRLFELAGAVFLATMVLHGLLDIRSVHTLNGMMRMSVGTAGVSGLAGVTWYSGVFEPILIGVVGLFVGLALGRVAEALTSSASTPSQPTPTGPSAP